MKTKILSLPLASIVIAVSISATAGESTDPAPAAARYYPFVGSWTGQGELSQPGQPAAKLALQWSCSEASSGHAVRCEMTAQNDSMTMTESDLMGVDPLSGEGHWYAVTNQGEVHDHVAQWSDPKTMTANYAWQQDGKQMQETVTFKLLSEKSLKFSSVVTADGQEVAAFSGDLAQ